MLLYRIIVFASTPCDLTLKSNDKNDAIKHQWFIIQQIYKGELFYAELQYPDDPEYLRLRRELESKLSRLNATLDKKQELLKDVLSLRVSMDGIGNADMIEAGFRLGAEIMKT